MADTGPDLLLLTAVAFETKITRKLHLSLAPPSWIPSTLPAFQGIVNNRTVLLVETGLRAVHLELLEKTIDAHHPTRGILSVGLAGGLSPELRGGDVVAPERVFSDGQEYQADAALIDLLETAGARRIERFAHSEKMLKTVEEKKKLKSATNAQAVDMESSVIAAWAAERRIPCATVKAISDPADRALPSSLTEDGISAASALLHLPSLLPLARTALKARRKLSCVLRNVLNER